MSKNLREILLNYHERQLLGDKVHIKGSKNGKEIFNDYYQVFATIESNYSKLAIIWPVDGILPVEYQDHYSKNTNRYPVKIEYFEEENIVHLSGKYFNDPYLVVIQLPEKERNID